jgi:hypothetical protein
MSALMYPQLGTGALSQYPIRKTRRMRTVINEAADGSTVRLADAAAELVEWRLEYVDLTDAEAALLAQFFMDAEGSLNGFTFVDPAGNLLAWSAKLDTDVWEKDPFLTVADGVADPAGETRAWTVANSGTAGQVIAQTVGVPGGYPYCFSVYLRSSVPGTVRLMIGEQAFERVVHTAWGRVVCAATPPPGESIRFGIELGAASAISVYGPQVEAQQGASVYRATTRGGVYIDAHLRDDTFSVTRTGCNRNSCTVNIVHANHL